VLEIIILIGAAAGTVTLGIGLAAAIVRNMRQGEQCRLDLAARLDKLRLGRALDAFGVEREHYLHSERVVDIEHHLRNCVSCEAVNRCDRCLSTADCGRAFEFCPNYPALVAVLSRA
jgi:hypothetical protein